MQPPANQAPEEDFKRCAKNVDVCATAQQLSKALLGKQTLPKNNETSDYAQVACVILAQLDVVDARLRQGEGATFV